MAQYLAPEQLELSSGAPLSGGKKHVYQTGTTTPLSLFSDDTLLTPAANPIVADASGAFAGVFLAETECKQIITTSAGVTVYTRAVVYTVGVSNVIAANDVSYDNASSGLAAETVQDALDEVVDLAGLTQEWTSSADGPIATGTSTNTGAAAGPLVEMYRNSASPAASDIIGGSRHTGKNAAGTKVTYSEDYTVILDTTNGSEDAKRVRRTMVAGALADRLHVGSGAWMDGATGGDPGAGKFNASEVQQAGVAIRPLVSGTVQATTSGTTVDFVSIPSWVTFIKVTMVDVSLNATSAPMIQIGDSGGIETTGYAGAGNSIGTDDTDPFTFSTGFTVHNSLGAAETISGTVTLARHNSTTNVWVAEISVHQSGRMIIGAGSKALSATMDRVRLTSAAGTATFDGGSVNVHYE